MEPTVDEKREGSDVYQAESCLKSLSFKKVDQNSLDHGLRQFS